MVVPYSFDDVVKALNDVVRYDWEGLLNERVNSTSTHAPLKGIEQGGWRLVYNDQPNQFVQASEKLNDSVNVAFSLGFWVKKDGELGDVIRGSPAYEAGVGAGMKLVAVNGRRWSREGLHDAIRLAQTGDQPIEIIVENKQFFGTHAIQYHGGEKNPHLERISSQPDRLSDITAPHAKPGNPGK